MNKIDGVPDVGFAERVFKRRHRVPAKRNLPEKISLWITGLRYYDQGWNA